MILQSLHCAVNKVQQHTILLKQSLMQPSPYLNMFCGYAFTWKICQFLIMMHAISIGEDNSAAQIIAHAGKLTRNVRHIATKKQALQENVCHGRVHFIQVSSACNLADHFTKALPYSILCAHCMTMMGYQFIDAGHRAVATLTRPATSVL